MHRLFLVLRTLAAVTAVAVALGPLPLQPAAAAPVALPTYLAADMVTLDRAYIAALALTSQEKLEPSQKAMAVLVPTWQAFQAKYVAANPADPQWRLDFDAVNGMIERADGIVRTGAPLVAAHEELEGVRITLMDLRERNGLEYYVDHLTRFHEPMEAIVLAGKDATPDSISPAEIAAIRAHLDEARAIWAVATAAPFDAALFGFTPEKQATMARQIAAESEALTRLDAALAGDDPSAVIQRAVALKPSFSVLFMLFGDFETLGG